MEDREVKQVVCEELCVIKIAYSDAQLNDASASTGDQSQPSAISGHACHANATSMSPSATPTNGDQARHQSQPSAISGHACQAKRRLL